MLDYKFSKARARSRSGAVILAGALPLTVAQIKKTGNVQGCSNGEAKYDIDASSLSR